MMKIDEQSVQGCVQGRVIKVRSKSTLSFSSSVGFSIDERYLVLTATHLHCFRKEPLGSFVFLHSVVDMRSSSDNTNTVSNNLIPYASIDLSSALNFVRPYDSSPNCRVFEIQDQSEVNGDRVFAFEAATAEEMRNKWLKPIQLRHQNFLTNEYSATKERRLAETPSYVKIFDGLQKVDGVDGPTACRAYFYEQVSSCYPETIPFTRDSEQWAANLKAAEAVLEYMEEITFETTVAPVPVVASSAQPFSYGSVSTVKEAPLGRLDVLALAVDTCRQILTARFRRLLFDEDALAELRVLESTPTSGTNKATKIATLSLSTNIVTTKGLEDLHSLVCFIVRYQRHLRALVTMTQDVSTIPSHAELFDYLPCIYQRYMNGVGDKGSSKLKSTNAIPAEIRGSTMKQRIVAPPPISSAAELQSDGAANQLHDHCVKVWASIRSDPADAILKHVDGTFYTEGPTAAWVCLHQHLSLAEEACASVLHVMVAEKVAAALCVMFKDMCTFVTPISSTHSIANRTENDKERTTTLDQLIEKQSNVKEVEVEFLCAIANDCGIHLDEILCVVENFKTIEGVKQHVDASFDGVSTALMQCATISLQRLVLLVLADVDEQYTAIFTTGWLLQGKQHSSDARSDDTSISDEGGTQVNVILNTLSDYLDDFRVFLVQFWYDKFCSMAFTLAINTYIDMIVTRISQINMKNTAAGFFGSIVNGGLSAATSIKPIETGASTGTVPLTDICKLEASSIAKIRKDIETLQRFITKFSKRTGSNIGVSASKYIELLKIFVAVLDVAVESVPEENLANCHLGKMLSDYMNMAPFCAPQLKIFVQMSLDCCANLHPNTKKLILDLIVTPESGQAAEAWKNLDMRAKQQKQQQEENMAGFAMSLCSFMRTSLNVPAEAPVASAEAASTIASVTSWARAPMSPLAALRSLVGGSGDIDESSLTNNHALHRNSKRSTCDDAPDQGNDRASSIGVSEDVLRLIREHEAVLLTEAQKAEREEAKATAALERGFFHCASTVDKRFIVQGKPAGMWQRRYIKLSSRRAEDESGKAHVIHSINWYKHQGGIVVGTLDVSAVHTITILAVARPLEYFPDVDHTRLAGSLPIAGIPVKPWRENYNPDMSDDESDATYHKDQQSNDDTFILRVLARGQCFELRCFQVDVLLKWVNTTTQAAGLSYDRSTRQFSRPAHEQLNTTIASWKKANVLEKKEESALSAIKLAKAQQKKERIDREKVQGSSSSAGSASSIIAATKLQHSQGTKETINPMLAGSSDMSATEGGRGISESDEYPGSPAVPVRRLSTSASADSLVAPKMKLTLELPSAIKSPMKLHLSDPAAVPLAPLTSPTPRASRSMDNLSMHNSIGMDTLSSPVACSVPIHSAPKTGRSAKPDKATPLNISSASRLRSSEMPAPRRSSLKSSNQNLTDLDRSRSSSLSSMNSERDNNWDQYSPSDSSKSSRRSDSDDDYSDASSVSSGSTSSNSTSSSQSSGGLRRKSVSFSNNELREYEPRSAPEELSDSGKEVPQTYVLSTVQRLPGQSIGTSDKNSTKKKKKKKKKRKDGNNPAPVADAGTGCCPCS